MDSSSSEGYYSDGGSEYIKGEEEFINTEDYFSDIKYNIRRLLKSRGHSFEDVKYVVKNVSTESFMFSKDCFANKTSNVITLSEYRSILRPYKYSREINKLLYGDIIVGENWWFEFTKACCQCSDSCWNYYEHPSVKYFK